MPPRAPHSSIARETPQYQRSAEKHVPALHGCLHQHGCLHSTGSTNVDIPRLGCHPVSSRARYVCSLGDRTFWVSSALPTSWFTGRWRRSKASVTVSSHGYPPSIIFSHSYPVRHPDIVQQSVTHNNCKSLKSDSRILALLSLS